MENESAEIKKNRRNIMGHRSVITASIFILGISLCDFFFLHLWKSCHTHNAPFLLDFYCILCLRKEEEENRTHSKKKNANWNKYIPIDRYAPKARFNHVYCIQAQPHIPSQTQMPRRVYISKLKMKLSKLAAHELYDVCVLYLCLCCFCSFNRNQIILLYIHLYQPK